MADPLLRTGALLVFALAGPAMAADLTCTFESECLEGEACADSGYVLTLRMGEDSATLEDDAGSVDVSALTGSDMSYVGTSATGAHLLTISGSGDARYSVHFMGATFSMLYLGQCSETD